MKTHTHSTQTIDKPVVIIGAGGHAKVLIDCLLASHAQLLGALDSDSTKHHQTILGIPILGGDEMLQQFKPQDIYFVNGLGTVGNPTIRNKIFQRYSELGYVFTSVIHPSAILARDVDIGIGAQIMAGAILQTGCVIGSNAIINTRATIDHDCHIGDNVHISPGAILCGNVKIGKNTHVGAGACVIQGVQVGEDCLIGAGAVVTKEVATKEKVKGVPAKSFVTPS